MDVEAGTFGEAGNVGIEHVEAAVHVRLAQVLHELGAQRRHGDLLEPAVGEEARHHEDLGALGLGEALFQRFADLLRSEVLVLDVDVVLRAFDHVHVEPIHLVDAGLLLAGRRGARDRRLDVGHVDAQLLGPDVLRALRGIERLAGGAAPALARDAQQHLRSLAVHRDHRVVEGRIGLLLEHAARIVGLVITRVPALVGDVESARESEAPVDHDDLLVVGARDGVRVVIAEVDAAMGFPRAPGAGGGLAIGAEHRGEIPVEDLHLQMALLAREAVQELAEEDGLARAVEVERRAAVEVPAEHDDGTLGALRRAHEDAEVVLGVDDEGNAAGARHLRAVFSGAKEGLRHRGETPSRAVRSCASGVRPPRAASPWRKRAGLSPPP